MKYYNGAGKRPAIAAYTLDSTAEFADASGSMSKKKKAAIAGGAVAGAAAVGAGARYGVKAVKTGIRVGKMAGGEKGLSRGTKVAAISAGRSIAKDAKAIGGAAVKGINSVVRQGYKTPDSLRTKIGSKLGSIGTAARKLITKGK